MLRYSYFFLLFRASLTLLSIPLLSSIYNVIAVNIFSACFWKPHQTMLWCLTFKRNLENSRGVYRIFPHCGLPGSFSLLDSSRFLLLFAFSLENFLLREVCWWQKSLFVCLRRTCLISPSFLYFFFCLFVFWLRLWDVEVPQSGIKPAPQQLQCRILNSLNHQGTLL